MRDYVRTLLIAYALIKVFISKSVRKDRGITYTMQVFFLDFTRFSEL